MYKKIKIRKDIKSQKMNKKWLTIYIPDHNPFGDISKTSKEHLMMVPEIKTVTEKNGVPFFTQVFHAIPRDELCKLSSILIPDYSQLLKKLSKRRFELINFHHNEYPVRFSILRNEEFEFMKKNKGNLNYYSTTFQSFFWEFNDLCNSSLPGIVVSMWDSLDSLKGLFPLSHYKRMQDRVGYGFGDRPSVPSGALNVYFGPNCSERPLPSPSYGPGIRKDVDYDRNYFHHDEYHQQLMEKINEGNSILLDHAKNIDNEYMNFIGINDSARKIWTQGISSRKVSYLNKEGKLITKRLKAGQYNGIGFF